jgi:gliding motility-associated-like protein
LLKLNKISNFFILACVLTLSSLANGSDIYWTYNNEILDPQVSFSSSPADDDNDRQITICAGTSVTFTDTSTNVPNDAEYEWNFEGGDPDFSEDVGPHEIVFDDEGTYTIELDIDGFVSNMEVNVINTDIEPEIDTNWGSSIVNGITYFTFCSNQTNGEDFLANFSFETDSSNTTPSSEHSLLTSAGDEINFTGENSQSVFGSEVEFFVSAGATEIIYSITDGPCTVEKIFNLYVGASPTANITNAGVPVLCTPGTVTYDITYGQQNGVGTTYTIEVSDDSAPIIFQHPPPLTYTHTFNNVSCGAEQVVFGDTTYDNAFEISITASNACGDTSTGFAPIYIESAPEADFTFQPELSNNVICQGTPLSVIDSTLPGANILNGECDDNYKRFWQITSPDGTILTSASNGSLDSNPYATVVGHMGFVSGGIDPNALSAANWSSLAATQIDVIFLQSGDYEVTLNTGGSGQSNQCGVTSYTQTICVTPEVDADFDMSTQLACGPEVVTITNNSTQTACDNQNIYDWTVTYQNPQNCPISSSPNWEFVNNTNSTSFEPEIQFNTPGEYEVSLTVSLDVDIIGTPCDQDIEVKLITIKETPQTSLPNIELCENESYTFDLTLFDCYAEDAATFEWDFQGATTLIIDDSNILNPTISFSEVGTYPYSLTLTNECGDNEITGVIEISPGVLVTTSAPNAICLNSDILLSGTVSGGTTSGVWTSSATGGTFAPSANDLVTSYTPPNNFTGEIIFTLTSDDSAGPCPPISDSVAVDIQPEATVNAGDYDPFCVNTAVQLAGSIGGAASSAAWSADVSGVFSNDNDLNAIFTPSTGFVGNINFTLTTDDPAGACESVTDTVTVLVTPEGQVDPISNYTFCDQDTTDPITFVTSEPGTVFNWTITGDDIGFPTPLSGQGNIPSFIATNAVLPIKVATITVIPTIISGATSCEGTPEVFTITVYPQPSIDTQPIADQAVCLDGTAQDLTVTHLDGVGLPTYQWYFSATCDTSDLSTPLSIAGSQSSSITPPITAVGISYYFAVLTFAQGGCDAITSDCARVEVVADPVATITPPSVSEICDGGEIGDIVVTYTGGVGTPTYQWYESIDSGSFSAVGGNTASYNPGVLVQGTYDYYVEISFNDNPDNGCNLATSQTVSFEVVSDPVLTDPLLTQTVCLGSPVSSLDVTASGGVGAYSYQWYESLDSGPYVAVGTDNPSYTPVPGSAGVYTYYVIVQAAGSGCETQSTIAEVIVTPSPSIDTQPIADQAVCLDGTAQDLTVTHLDGVGLPTYQWYFSATCDTSDLSTPLSIAGSQSSSITPPITAVGISYYFAVLTFAQGGCDAITSDCARVEVKPKAIVPDVFEQICDESSYALNPIDGLIPDTNTIIPGGTIYSWTFTPNPLITGATNVGVSENINVFDSGILYNIDPLYNLQTIVFDVTPWTDGCGGDSFKISVTVSPDPQINEVITNINCSNTLPLCSGSIEINPVGVGPFTYNWSAIDPIGNPLNDPTEKDQFDLCPGFYELSITDGSGCSYEYEYEITLPDPIEFNDEIVTDVSCNNINQLPCDGSIQVTPNGGTLPYSLIQWTRYNPATLNFEDYPNTTPLTPFELTNICAGDYVLKILDANGCEFLSPVYSIEEGASPIDISETISNYNGFNIDCFSANTGSISVDISGGSGNFTYIFSNGNPLEDQTGTLDLQLNPSTSPLIFSSLTAGNYTLTINDIACPLEIIRNYNLTQPDELVITATLVDPIECFGELAIYDITATGGIPPYSGTGLQSVLSGAFTFTVLDANGCQDDFSTVVAEPAQLLATHTINDAPCFGDNGQINVTPDGGTGIITVNLYDSTPTFITSVNTSQGSLVTFNQLAGTYFYDVVDQNSCASPKQVVIIDQPDPIIINDFDVVQPNCNTLPAWEFNNGSICITIIGGTNPFPIGAGWVDNGGGQWCLNNLSVGSYAIDVTDANGCSLQNPIPDITLVRPAEITAVLTNTIDIDCDTDTVTQINTIIVNGGVPPYIVTWSGGDVDASNPFVMETSVPGNYSAFVNDRYGITNGCPPIAFPLDPITFFDFGVPDFSLSSANSNFCGVYAVSDPITLTNISTGDIVSFEWNFGDGSPPISNINTLTHVYDVVGSYTVSLTLEDLYGCIETYSETINVTQGYEIILPNAFTPNGDGINETIRPVYNCMTEVKLSIYDTWGSLIYAETAEDIYGWDGTIDGNPAENGNYIMVVRAEAFNGAIVDLNGPITLIR